MHSVERYLRLVPYCLYFHRGRVRRPNILLLQRARRSNNRLKRDLARKSFRAMFRGALECELRSSYALERAAGE